jgi:hypothetical protein
MLRGVLLKGLTSSGRFRESSDAASGVELTLRSDIFKQNDPLLDALPCGALLAQ